MTYMYVAMYGTEQAKSGSRPKSLEWTLNGALHGPFAFSASYAQDKRSS